jgi:hypothetical protein
MAKNKQGTAPHANPRGPVKQADPRGINTTVKK